MTRLWYAVGFLLPPVGIIVYLILAGRAPAVASAAGRGARAMLFALLALATLAAFFVAVFAVICAGVGADWFLSLR